MKVLIITFFAFLTISSFGNDCILMRLKENADTIPEKYRSYNHQQFKVIDTTALWIYQYQTKVVDMVKVSAKSTKVVNKVVTDYYFSLNGQSELFQFSLSNIKLLFLFNQTSYQELCQRFKTTESILAKSDKGTYLLNDFLNDLISRGFKICK